MIRRLLTIVALAALPLPLAACTPDPTGSLALAVDPAGRLVAVVAVCAGQELAWLSLTDESTGTSTTIAPQNTPDFGATILLTGPVGDPRPEGALDLLDRGHDYLLTAGTSETGQTEQSGTLAGIRFRLDAALKEKKLSTGSVLWQGKTPETTAVITRDEFVAGARKRCD